MGEPLDIPDKLLFRIGEVCDLLGVRPHVLRYWETEFAAVRPEKSRSNQRLYRRRDVEVLAEVKRLLYEEGYTIAGARKRLRRPAAPRPAEDGSTAAAPPRGLQSPPAGRIRGPASAAPEAAPAAPARNAALAAIRDAVAVPADEAPRPTTATADLAARCAALERELQAERDRGAALRDRLRVELDEIARLAEEPPESDGA